MFELFWCGPCVFYWRFTYCTTILVFCFCSSVLIKDPWLYFWGFIPQTLPVSVFSECDGQALANVTWPACSVHESLTRVYSHASSSVDLCWSCHYALPGVLGGHFCSFLKLMILHSHPRHPVIGQLSFSFLRKTYSTWPLVFPTANVKSFINRLLFEPSGSLFIWEL